MPLRGLVLDFLTLIEGLVTLALNPAEVDEQIFAAILRGDEPIPFSALNQFTVPVAMPHPPYESCYQPTFEVC